MDEIHFPSSGPATQNSDGPVTFAPHYGPCNGPFPRQEGSCPRARAVKAPFCACVCVYSCALWPRLLLPPRFSPPSSPFGSRSRQAREGSDPVRRTEGAQEAHFPDMTPP